MATVWTIQTNNSNSSNNEQRTTSKIWQGILSVELPTQKANLTLCTSLRRLSAGLALQDGDQLIHALLLRVLGDVKKDTKAEYRR